MATLEQEIFDRKARDADGAKPGYAAPMINNVMNGREWAILLALAVIWGGAFFFIKVAVTHVDPLTYVWLRLTIAAIALWLVLRWQRDRLKLPREVWGAILVLALLNNVIPFALFGWGQMHIASGLASILNATTPIWGVFVAHLLTRDERMTPLKLLGVLIGFGGVATADVHQLRLRGGCQRRQKPSSRHAGAGDDAESDGRHADGTYWTCGLALFCSL